MTGPAVMTKKTPRSRLLVKIARNCTGALSAALLVSGELPATAQAQETASSSQPAQKADRLPADQLDALVAPIALYPDPLLAQTLAASTYPLELIQLQQWLKKNPKLKDKDLADAVAKEPWDPSVQSMAGLPDVVNRLADDIQWTTDLGNAFLAQESDVMDAVQRMRGKAKDNGNLKSTEQQKVETKEVENKTVIVVEQADPQVVYVPSYNPVVVYGAPVYPYPPIYYPPPGYYAAGMAISFGVGVAMGAMWSGGWGYGPAWGASNVQVNNYNSFNRNTNVNRNVNANRNSNWQHNAQHRGGAPYGDRATADRFGGGTRGESAGNRQGGARQQAQGGDVSSRAAQGGGAGNRTGGAGVSGSRRWQPHRRDRSQQHRKPGSVGQRWRKPGRLRRRGFRGIQRVERPLRGQPRCVQHGTPRRGRWLQGWRWSRTTLMSRVTGESRSEERTMQPTSASGKRSRLLWTASAATSACLLVAVLFGQPQSTADGVPPAPADSGTGGKSFSTPQQAADALVAAAEKFDELALEEIFGPDGDDLVLTGEYPQDRQRATDFAAEAHEKQSISLDPKTGSRAILSVGNANWPFPVPIVKTGDTWSFDPNAGRQELLYRRIGYNELDAIQICHGYVEAQQQYAFAKREGYAVHQYAQRVISTPGKQDGLAWQNPDGTWGGPIGEAIARAIEHGYTAGAQPYHGYLFKILKGQGPAAPLGEMDFVVEGVMIGGFALVAAPVEYRITGVKTFIVSHDGVVYQKDFGPATLEEFKKMERFNPDKSWTRVPD